MEELKPCECGLDSELNSAESYCGDRIFWVTCYNCLEETNAYSSKEKAIEAWNRRAKDAD